MSIHWTRREQKTLVPVRPANVKYSHEHHNLASDYVYGREHRKPETPNLSFDQYISLVRDFAVMARVLILRKEP